MQIKRSRKFMAILCVIFIGINNIVLSTNNQNEKYTVKSQIAKPIFIIEKDKNIEEKINVNSFPIEYNFCIKNYDEKNINEVEFIYDIELDISDENFPIQYTLYDCDNRIEIDGRWEKYKNGIEKEC